MDGLEQTPTQTDQNAKVTAASSGSRRLPLRWLIGGLVLVVLVAGFLIYFLVFRTTAPKVPAGLNAEQQSWYLSNAGDYKAAEQVWQQKLGAASDTPTKLGIYYQQAAVAIKFKRYDDAKKYASQAMQLDPRSYIPYSAYASIAEAQGDKDSEKHYLQQTIAHIDPSLNGANLIARDYQSKLDALK